MKYKPHVLNKGSVVFINEKITKTVEPFSGNEKALIFLRKYDTKLKQFVDLNSDYLIKCGITANDKNKHWASCTTILAYEEIKREYGTGWFALYLGVFLTKSGDPVITHYGQFKLR